MLPRLFERVPALRQLPACCALCSARWSAPCIASAQSPMTDTSSRLSRMVVCCLALFFLAMYKSQYVHALQARARQRQRRTWRRRWRSSASCSTAATAWTTSPWPSSSRGWPPLAPGAVLLEKSYRMLLIGLLKRSTLARFVMDLTVLFFLFFLLLLFFGFASVVT